MKVELAWIALCFQCGHIEAFDVEHGVEKVKERLKACGWGYCDAEAMCPECVETAELDADERSRG